MTTRVALYAGNFARRDTTVYLERHLSRLLILSDESVIDKLQPASDSNAGQSVVTDELGKEV